MTFTVGDKFPSFSAFEGALEILKKETNTDFYIHDSKTLKGYRDCPLRAQQAPEILKYTYVKYKCMHGGTYKKSKHSKGLRNTSTLRLGCEAFIYVRLSEDAKDLVIQSMYLEHNHNTNEALYTHVPRPDRKGKKALRIKLNNLKDGEQEKFKNKDKYLVREKTSQNAEISASLRRDLTSSNESNKDTQIPAPEEIEVMCNPADSLPEGIELGEKLCKCGIGTWELTKQDLMLMEVEEHHRRLEILQLQEAFQTERIEKMRYLQDLKIRKAEQELKS